MKHEISNGHIYLKCIQDKQRNGFNLAQIRDEKRQIQWLFFHPKQWEPVLKESYDQQYFGGMEFLFPNDEEEYFRGKKWPDHGVLWKMPFRVDTTEDSIKAEAFEKEHIRAEYKITLKEACIFMEFTICNLSDERHPFLVRLHPSLPIGQKDVLGLCGEEIYLEGKEGKYCSFRTKEIISGKCRIITEEEKIIDIEAPDTWEKEEIFFHVKQNKGQFSIDKKDARIIYTYNSGQFPYLTVYSFYDKKAGRVAVIEPASSCGTSFRTMEENGSLQYLEPFQEICFPVKIEIR